MKRKSGLQNSSFARTTLEAGLVFLLLAFLACSCNGTGTGESGTTLDERPPVELSSSVDRVQAGVSEPVVFRVTLDTAPGVKVSLPEIGSMIQGFRILDMGSEGPSEQEGRMWMQEWFELEGDIAGSYLLPPIKVTYTTPDGQEGSVEAPQIFVEISSAPESEDEEGDIRDIKPLENIKREFPLAWAVAGGCFVLLATCVAAWILYRRRSRLAEQELLPPDELARRELRDLEATGILEEQRFREYVFNLSLIFRRYLERKYRIAAAEQTSEEIMAGLRRGGALKDDLKQMTRSFLEETDPIKYCGLDPRDEETEKLRSRLLTFLEESVRGEGDEEFMIRNS